MLWDGLLIIEKFVELLKIKLLYVVFMIEYLIPNWNYLIFSFVSSFFLNSSIWFCKNFNSELFSELEE